MLGRVNRGETTYMVASKYARLRIVMPLETLLNVRGALGSGLTSDNGIRGGRPYVTLSQLSFVVSY
jgi:hypothetical protein